MRAVRHTGCRGTTGRPVGRVLRRFAKTTPRLPARPRPVSFMTSIQQARRCVSDHHFDTSSLDQMQCICCAVKLVISRTDMLTASCMRDGGNNNTYHTSNDNHRESRTMEIKVAVLFWSQRCTEGITIIATSSDDY